MPFQESRWIHLLIRGRRWEYLLFLAVLASLVYILRTPGSPRVDVVREHVRFIGDVSTPKQTTYEKQTIHPGEINSKRNLAGIETNSKQPQEIVSIKSLPPPVTSKHVAICMASGRLGNLMFTYASVYGLAKRKNMSVVVDESNPLLKDFKLDAKPVKINSLHGYLKLTETRACDFDEKMTWFDPHKDVLFERYLQSWKYFFHVEDLVRAQFQFSDSTMATADKIISKIRLERSTRLHNATVTVIGIHFRRGDKMKQHFQNFGYVIAPTDYVKRAMTYFRLLHDNTVFVLASDSPDYMKTALNDDDIVYLDKYTAIEDMATMARCDHLITTIGSFGWWAGFLNKGKVLYYKHPAREGSDLRKDFGESYSNYFHPKWTGLK